MNQSMIDDLEQGELPGDSIENEPLVFDEDGVSEDDGECSDNVKVNTEIVSIPVVAEPAGFEENGDVPLDLKTFWPLFLEYLIHERPNIGSFLALAYAFPEGNNGISLKFAPTYKFQYLEITKKNNRDEIERLLQKFSKRQLELHITIESKPVTGQEQNYIKTIGNVSSTIDDEIEREPIIKLVLDYFDGEILD